MNSKAKRKTVSAGIELKKEITVKFVKVLENEFISTNLGPQNHLF